MLDSAYARLRAGRPPGRRALGRGDGRESGARCGHTLHEASRIWQRLTSPRLAAATLRSALQGAWVARLMLAAVHCCLHHRRRDDQSSVQGRSTPAASGDESTEHSPAVGQSIASGCWWWPYGAAPLLGRQGAARPLVCQRRLLGSSAHGTDARAVGIASRFAFLRPLARPR